MYSLGIDIGYSAVKTAAVDPEGGVAHGEYRLHRGHIIECLQDMLTTVENRFGHGAVTQGAVTGSGSAFLSTACPVTSVNEVAALIEGVLKLDGESMSIIEIGGQSAKYITGFTQTDKSRVEISMNPNCASGTGSFLEEQVSRLNLAIEDFAGRAAKATFIPGIAGRCSVFAKTDITHHQQQGVAIENILAGLAHAVVRNYKSAVMRRLTRHTPVFFAGGVALNDAITAALVSILGLDREQLLVHPYSPVVGAIGAAILARQNRSPLDPGDIRRTVPAKGALINTPQEGEIILPPLFGFGQDDGENRHQCRRLEDRETPVPCYLGIDVGSTSTNLVLIDADRKIVACKYLRTAGNPVDTVTTGLRQLGEAFGNRVKVCGVGTTGSGRHMIGRLVGADLVRDEITAQARAAVTIDPEVDTVFEIGGQDSKFISLADGVVRDFRMNKVCAAGTGSFIEEQAIKMGIDLEDFSRLFAESRHPVNLGERCTVFMETSIAAHLAQGAAVEDLAAGLCYSIVKNYLNRVVGRKKIGTKIFLQGGLGYNQGVVNAFRAVTGKAVTVPPFFSVTGAYGAALMVSEAMPGDSSAFRGFDIAEAGNPAIGSLTLHAEQDRHGVFNRRIQDLIFEGYDGAIEPGKKTIGIPRALFTYGMFPMFFPFFRELGFNVLLSEPTNEHTVRLAQAYSLDETCYPVKLINGHAAELVSRNIDYLFLPDLFTVMHPGSLSRQNYGCAYMQMAFKLINQAMDLESKGIRLLAPTIAFSLGQDFMKNTFMEMGRRLGKKEPQVMKAMQKGMESFFRFEEKRVEHARNTMAALNPAKKTIVLISKIYGVGDPMLNMGVPDKLMEMGYPVIPFYALPEVDIFKQHPNMYWPFGQHILEAAKIVRQHPHLHAVFLTHHGCGPDTVISHYFREIMGSKPYLNIEVDEHSSDVGVVTRVEAFVNSLESAHSVQGLYNDFPTSMAQDVPVAIRQETGDPKEIGRLYLPYLYPYAQIAREILAARGFDAAVMPSTTEQSIDLGRRHTITNEYFSMTALLGDVLQTIATPGDGRQAFFLPQNEGAEVDGQYSRFIRSKLDERGRKDIAVISPFMEDLAGMQTEDVKRMFLGLLAGDLVMIAPSAKRGAALESILELIRRQNLNLDSLLNMAREIRHIWREVRVALEMKRIFAIGEPLVLFNDTLNNHTFERIEAGGHRVIYAPLSEYLQCVWHDGLKHHSSVRPPQIRRHLALLDEYMERLSTALREQTPYAGPLEDPAAIADRTLGYYSGSFGRYREGRILGRLPHVNGVITAISMYENTGITLRTLHKSFAKDNAVPVLHLTFDGYRNDNDRIKIDSFLYYV